MAKIRPGTTCVYCRVSAATTHDHVPPQCVFEKRNRDNPVKVPSCRSCNNGCSDDDEYFRQALYLHEEVSSLPQAKEPLEATLRALGREDHPGARQDFLGSLVVGPKLKDGHVGTGLYFGAKASRLNAVASRIVAGMFWVASGRALPTGYVSFALETSSFDRKKVPEDLYVVDIESAERRGHVDKGNVFFAAVERNAHDANITRWLLGFHGKLFFAGFTLPTEGLSEETMRVVRELDPALRKQS